MTFSCLLFICGCANADLFCNFRMWPRFTIVLWCNVWMSGEEGCSRNLVPVLAYSYRKTSRVPHLVIRWLNCNLKVFTRNALQSYFRFNGGVVWSRTSIVGLVPLNSSLREESQISTLPGSNPGMLHHKAVFLHLSMFVLVLWILFHAVQINFIYIMVPNDMK